MPDQVKHAIDRLSINDNSETFQHAVWEDASPSGYVAPPEVNKALARATELLRQGHRDDAQAILKGLRRYAEKNPHYWETILKSANNRKQAKIALKHIVTLRPQSQEAWALLHQLDPEAATYLADKMHYRLTGIPQTKTRRQNRHFRRLVVFAFFALILLTAFASIIYILPML